MKNKLLGWFMSPLGAAGLLLAGCALLFYGGYSTGKSQAEKQYLADQAKVVLAAKKNYEAEVALGNKAAGNYLAAQQTMRTEFDQLQEKFNGLRKRAPLVVATGAGACPGSGDVPAARAGEAGDPGLVEPVLTAAAVWMWNSALTGTDQPAGACGALDTSTAACAAATSLTVDDAWANHTKNARICAENRLAYDRLMDYLDQREQKKSASPKP